MPPRAEQREPHCPLSPEATPRARSPAWRCHYPSVLQRETWHTLCTRPPARVMAPAARIPGLRRVRHVLIVEDESPIRVMLTDLLSDAGYAVLQAADGFEAIKHLRKTRPDLIVLDLMMPGLSGWQFLERSHDDLEQANIPVMILSAIKGGSDYPAALGVAAWLTKPVDVDQFLASVEQMAGPMRPPRPTSLRGPQRILVIEDERPIRDLIVEHLREEGFQTV